MVITNGRPLTSRTPARRGRERGREHEALPHTPPTPLPGRPRRVPSDPPTGSGNEHSAQNQGGSQTWPRGRLSLTKGQVAGCCTPGPHLRPSGDCYRSSRPKPLFWADKSQGGRGMRPEEAKDRRRGVIPVENPQQGASPTARRGGPQSRSYCGPSLIASAGVPGSGLPPTRWPGPRLHSRSYRVRESTTVRKGSAKHWLDEPREEMG
jgi:hypothetical protein